jgi:hypothetical protein
MRSLKKYSLIWVMALVVLVSTSCGGMVHVGVPASAEATISKDLDMLAQVDKAATDVIIQLQRAGAIKVDQARPVLDWTYTVAKTTNEAQRTVASTTSTADKMAAVAAMYSLLPHAPSSEGLGTGISSTVQSIDQAIKKIIAEVASK